MDSAYKNFQREIFIKELMKMDIFLDMVSIFGQMEATSKVNTKMDYAMAMESGRNSQAIVINMRENIEMIKKTDMVYSHGETATHIKVTIRMI